MDKRTERVIAILKAGGDPVLALVRELREVQTAEEAWELCSSGNWVVLCSVKLESSVAYSLGRIAGQPQTGS